VGTVLNQIYEEDFLGFSYGFRPGRSQHDALDALWMGIMRKKVNWVLDPVQPSVAEAWSLSGYLSQALLVREAESGTAVKELCRRAGVGTERAERGGLA
jgi:hypothetical protein